MRRLATTAIVSIWETSVLVFSRLSKKREGKDWVTVNFAIGSNRIANFNQSRLLSAYNGSNSLTAYYAQSADGVLGADLGDQEQNQYIENLAYQTDLLLPLSPDSVNTEYVGIAHNGLVQQDELLTTKGGVDEISFSVGANYKDKLYLGAALGIPTTRYKSEITFSETDIHDSIPDFKSFQVIDYLKVTGAGINAKFGAIYRIHNNFRAGISVHTPTVYAIDEDFSNFMRSEFELDPTTLEAASPNGINSYRLRTPMKLEASAAAVFKQGFVSVDYEWVPHHQTEYSPNEDDDPDPSVTLFYNNLNASIDNAFKASHNIRVGGEAVIDKFRLRAGYAYYGSPYQNGDAEKRQSITGGLGFRDKKFFVDLAYVHALGERYYQPYTLEDKIVSAAKINESAGNWLTTIGFKF